MSLKFLPIRQIVYILSLGFTVSVQANPAATPNAEQALKLSPIQKDVEYDRPSAAETAKCTIKSEKVGNAAGWVVRDGNGHALREFVDTNADNVVDRWSYFQEGVEVYRDIDADFNGKADAYRWMNTAGSRWGLDKNEDGLIDSWKLVSAEEVTAELVSAVKAKDLPRFSRLLLSGAELKNLGLGADRAKNVNDKVTRAQTAFVDLCKSQRALGPTSKWVHFGASRPGMVPAGVEGSTADVLVYENVVAMVDTDGKTSQVIVGTLIKVGDAWRMIDAPTISTENADLAANGFFFAAPKRLDKPETAPGGPSETLQKSLADVEKIDAQLAKASSANEKTRLNDRRADLIEAVIAEVGEKERGQWVRQLADSISAAVQAGEFTTGLERLKKFQATLESSDDKELLAYVKFRNMTAEYAQGVQAPGADYAKIQIAWLDGLEKFVTDFPQSPDTVEALLQLAVAQEFAGQEEKAKKWYDQIMAGFPGTPYAKRATGALTRLNSVGRPMALCGKTTTGQNFDVVQLRGKVVVIQYWATWCEPAKADMAQLKELQAKYAKEGFVVVGVNLDTETKTVGDFLLKNKLPWAQLYEAGGLDSRFAYELGIHTLPTMILIDAKGNVVNRGIHVAELDAELRNLFK